MPACPGSALLVSLWLPFLFKPEVVAAAVVEAVEVGAVGPKAPSLSGGYK